MALKLNICSAVAVVLCLFECAAWAGLGDRPDSAQSEGSRLSAHHAVTVREAVSSDPQAYSVYQLEMDNNLTVKEFVNSSGTVFAVEWSGPYQPNQKLILSTYFDRIQQSVKSSNQNGYRGRRPTIVESDDLVYKTSGHPGHFIGQAYLPKEFPTGFTLGSL